MLSKAPTLLPYIAFGFCYNTMTKGNYKGRGLFGLTVLGHNPSLKEVKTRAQKGTEAEAIKEYCLLA